MNLVSDTAVETTVDKAITPTPSSADGGTPFTSKLLELMHLDEHTGLVALASAPLLVMEIMGRALASAGSGLVAPASLLCSGLVAIFLHRRRQEADPIDVTA